MLMSAPLRAELDLSQDGIVSFNTSTGKSFDGVIYAPHTTSNNIVIVFAHGKRGHPQIPGFFDMFDHLNDAGFSIISLFTPWTGFTWLDTVEDGQALFTSAIDMASFGGRDVFLVGHSMGGGQALLYGTGTIEAPHPNLKGIIPFAPGHFVERSRRTRDATASSVTLALSLFNAGDEDVQTTFTAFGDGAPFELTSTPRSFISFWDPNSTPKTTEMFADISLPVLWVAGETDRLTTVFSYPDMVAQLNDQGSNQYTVLAGKGHSGILDPEGGQTIINWINTNFPTAGSGQNGNISASGFASDNDITGDSKSDILIRRNNGIWRLHPVDGRFVQFDSNFGAVNISSNANLQTQDVSDYNGDGNSDVLLRNVTSGAWQLVTLSGRTITSQNDVALPNDLQWQFQGAADFTGDSRSDVVLRHSQTQAWRLYPMNGSSVLDNDNNGSIAITQNPDFQFMAAADFTGDGFADLLLRNLSNGLWFMLPMQGRTAIQSSLRGGVPITQDLNWQVAGAKDMTEDGSADLLLRNVATGQWILFPLNGRNVDRGTNYGGVRFLATDLSWQPVQVDDFTGDGIADVLIRNTVTGAWRMHPMNGKTVVRDDNFGGVAVTSDLSWDLQ